MKKLPLLLAISALALSAASAQAQSMYGEIAYQTLDVGLNSDPAIVRGTVGYEINPNMAVEGMIGFGASDAKDSYLGVPVSLKVDNVWGIFAKPKMQLGNSFEIYGRAGYAGLKATASASAYGFTATESANDSDFAYGAGITYMPTPKMTISADFMKYSDVDAYAVGVGFKF